VQNVYGLPFLDTVYDSINI